MTNVFDGMDGVLFDMDGTLVETNIDFALMKREIVAFAESRGLPASLVQGLDILAVVNAVVEHVKASDGSGVAALVREEAFRLLEEIEIEPCSHAQPVAHAPELLDALRSAGLRVGIVTRNCRNAVACAMERTGISAEVLITRDDVLNTKPHPDHLLSALRLLEVSPDRSMMVGDHRMDIQGGKAAGMRTVGFLRPGRPADFFGGFEPDLVIHDLGELLSAVERLKKRRPPHSG
jgi:phosphoglycolate phosphatase